MRNKVSDAAVILQEDPAALNTPDVRTYAFMRLCVHVMRSFVHASIRSCVYSFIRSFNI